MFIVEYTPKLIPLTWQSARQETRKLVEGLRVQLQLNSQVTTQLSWMGQQKRLSSRQQKLHHTLRQLQSMRYKMNLGYRTLRIQAVLIYGFWAPKSLNNDYLDP